MTSLYDSLKIGNFIFEETGRISRVLYRLRFFRLPEVVIPLEADVTIRPQAAYPRLPFPAINSRKRDAGPALVSYFALLHVEIAAFHLAAEGCEMIPRMRSIRGIYPLATFNCYSSLWLSRRLKKLSPAGPPCYYLAGGKSSRQVHLAGTGVTRYAVLRSPDFPPCLFHQGDHILPAPSQAFNDCITLIDHSLLIFQRPVLL